MKNRMKFIIRVLKFANYVTNLDQNKIRKRKIPKKLEHYFTESIQNSEISESDSISSMNFKISLYYESIDCIITNINSRFDNKLTDILIGINACHPKSKHFINFEIMIPFATHYNLNLYNLKSNVETAKLLLKECIHIFDVYDKLIDYSNSMPDLMITSKYH